VVPMPSVAKEDHGQLHRELIVPSAERTAYGTAIVQVIPVELSTGQPGTMIRHERSLKRIPAAISDRQPRSGL
jgi:hypothetical protein